MTLGYNADAEADLLFSFLLARKARIPRLPPIHSCNQPLQLVFLASSRHLSYLPECQSLPNLKI